MKIEFQTSISFGIDISAGGLNNIIIENNGLYHFAGTNFYLTIKSN